MLIMLALLPGILFAQAPADNFTLKGKVGSLNAPARVYLIYEEGGKNVIDSTTMVGGMFKFHGHLADPVSAVMVTDPTAIGMTKLQRATGGLDVLKLYLDKSDIVLSDADSLSKTNISGSKANDDNKKLQAAMLPFAQRATLINNEYQTAPDAQKIYRPFQDSIAAKYKRVQDEQTIALKGFILSNPNSFISLECIRTLVKSGMQITSIEEYYVKLTPAVKQSGLGKSFGSAINELKITAIGSPAPDFTQNDVNGTPVKLSSFRGKYVLIDFWASWCGPCRIENPHVVSTFNKYKGKNFTILGISLDKTEDKALWLKAIKDDALDWTQVSDLKYWTNDVATLYKVSFIPQNFLIDPSGKIIAKNLKGADLDSKLAEIFKM